MILVFYLFIVFFFGANQGYYVILYYIRLCYVMLCYIMFYYIYIILYIVLYYILLYLYHFILYYIIFYFTILYYIILYYIILYVNTLKDWMCRSHHEKNAAAGRILRRRNSAWSVVTHLESKHKKPGCIV